MAATNMWGGVAGGMSSVRDPNAPWGGLPTGGMMPSGGSLYGGTSLAGANIPSAFDANAANLAFTRGATASDPTFKAAKTLLNPNDPNAMYDVAMKGAEAAVGGGTVGSGVSGQYTGRLRQYDIERRAALGNQLLSGAYGRTPQPVDPYAASRLQMDANAENNRLISSIQNRYAPSGGFSQGGGGGGGRSAPMVIGGGGGGGGGQPYASTLAASPNTPMMSPGSNQVAYGQGGPDWNAASQATQFYKGEYAPGKMYSGSVAGAPTWPSEAPLSNDDWENIYAGAL